MDLRFGPFRVPKRPISPSKTAHFALRNGPFCNVLTASVLRTRVNTVRRNGIDGMPKRLHMWAARPPLASAKRLFRLSQTA